MVRTERYRRHEAHRPSASCCRTTYLGEVEGANLIKIHRRPGKISYLVYPDFFLDGEEV
ncbi:MAG TPA: hypothetical protein VMR25_17295 [Planctomycetaceae bacterium]|nr:hypothetical protein [Planctomycetaceae bacterium]